jgi:septum site-determining protein MinD
LTINVASVLAAVPDSRVALIDLDSPVGDVAMYLNLSSPHKIADVLSAGSRLDSLLLDNCMIQADGFSVLSAPREFAPNRAASADTFARLLKVVAQNYTQTVIDLPHSLPVEHLQAVVKAAEALVIVLNPDLSSISRTGHLLRRLSVCDATDKIRLVINRNHDSAEIAAGLIEKALHHPIYYRIPEGNKDSMKALMSGRPLVRTHDCPLARSYQELARQVAGIPSPKGRRRRLAAGPGTAPRKSAFSSFLSLLGKPFRSNHSATGLRPRAVAAEHRLHVNLRD